MSRGIHAAVEEVERFVVDECAARRATYVGDEPEYEAATARAAAHLSSPPGAPLALGFGRAAGEGPSASDAAREAAERLRPRPVFIATGHRDGERTVYRVIVGGHEELSARRYAQALHVANVGGELKIVGRAAVSPFEPGDELTWEPLGGDQLEGAGPPCEIAKLRKPESAASAAHFDAQEPVA